MKWTLSIILIILASLITIGFFVYYDSAYLLSTILSRDLKVPVKVQKVEYKEQQILIHNIIIYNPKESKLPIALKAKTVSIQAPYKNYFYNPINIDRVVIDDVYAGIEFYTQDQSAGNWVTIVNNMNKDRTSIWSVERKAYIGTLIIRNISIELLLKGSSPNKLSPINQLTYHHVDTDKGIPTEEISSIIIRKLIDQLFIIKGLKAIFSIPKDAFDILISPLKLFEKKDKKSSPSNQSPTEQN